MLHQLHIKSGGCATTTAIQASLTLLRLYCRCRPSGCRTPSQGRGSSLRLESAPQLPRRLQAAWTGPAVMIQTTSRTTRRREGEQQSERLRGMRRIMDSGRCRRQCTGLQTSSRPTNPSSARCTVALLMLLQPRSAAMIRAHHAGGLAPQCEPQICGLVQIFR